MRLQLLLGDCVARMAEMPSESVDALVSDPPYGLEFMGKAWDKLDWQAGGGFSKPGIGARQTAWPSFNSHTPFGSANPTCSTCGGRLRGAKKCSCAEPAWKVKGEVASATTTKDAMRAQQEWHTAWLAEAYRVLVPGEVVKAFGGSRTYHRLAAAMEDVGFVDIHLEAWAYGSGFPKSLDVGKAVAAHELTGRSDSKVTGSGEARDRAGQHWSEFPKTRTAAVDVKPRDARWSGWGTALKPAWEPVVVGRKPVLFPHTP